jgi:hypothetical protein
MMPRAWSQNSPRLSIFEPSPPSGRETTSRGFQEEAWEKNLNTNTRGNFFWSLRRSESDAALSKNRKKDGTKPKASPPRETFL